MMWALIGGLGSSGWPYKHLQHKVNSLDYFKKKKKRDEIGSEVGSRSRRGLGKEWRMNMMNLYYKYA